MHGEYGDLKLGPRANYIARPAINPARLSFNELVELTRIPDNATNQLRVLREAWSTVIDN